MRVVDALLELADRAGVGVWYRRLMPKAMAVYMREPGLPPVLVMDCDILLERTLHTTVLAVLLTWHFSTAGERVWGEIRPGFARRLREELVRP